MNLNNSEIVLATHNAGKVSEIKELLEPFGCKVESSLSLRINEVVEDGLSFEENALIKARYTTNQVGKIALSDDSGLCVEALDGRPGIFSARYAGRNKDFLTAMKKLEQEMLSYDNKRASFVCALALTFPDGKEDIFTGEVFGELDFRMLGNKGFGYDPIFVPTGYKETFAQIDKIKKNSISHRSIAFKKLVKKYFKG